MLFAKYLAGLGIVMILAGFAAAAHNEAIYSPEPTTHAISKFYLLFVSGPGALIFIAGLMLVRRAKPS